MSMRNTLAGAVMALAAVAGVNGTAKAAVAFDNYGAGFSVNQNVGWTISTSSTPPGHFDQAMGFQSATTGSLTQIDIALSHVTGAGTAVISLWTSSGGTLGVELGHWNVTATTQLGDSPVDLSLSGLSGVNLTAGSNYFLEASATGDTWDAWNLNKTGSSGPHWVNGGADTDTLGAFDVLTTATVPEPAAWAMMLTGFAGLGAMLRRSRRRSLSAAA